MAKLNFNNEQMLTKIANTKSIRHAKMSRNCNSSQRTASDCKKQNNSTFSAATETSSRRSPPDDQTCSTIIHSCFCQRRRTAYFSAARSCGIMYAMLSLYILLCFSAMSQPALARSTSARRSAKAAIVATSPLAAPLLGNAASSASLLNSTTLINSDHEKNALDVSATVKPTPAVENRRALKLALLNNASVVCNDGSRAGFYLRKNPNSKKWIVFLEGGWHCYDTRSCRARWLRLRHLMTSAQWPETRDVGGILSPLPEENPYWHNANHVLVPYCSSDSWSGTRATIDETAEWRFMGALIIRQVIAELIPLGLGRVPGAELLLVGSSAGGLGVMLNLDYITNYLQNERKLMVTVRGVSDSGWFLDREPYTPATVGSSEAVRQGWKLWHGSLPDACTKQYQAEPWRCYFGYRLYPTLNAPLFVFQWLFDEAQMRADNVGAPVTPQQWNYIHEMGGALRSSLDNVTGVFAPSCIGHAVLSKRDWINIKIDDISLPSALRCWEHSTRPRRRRHNDKQHHESELHERRRHRPHLQQQTPPKHHRLAQHKERNDNNHQPQNGVRQRLTKVEREERRRLRYERQQRRLRKQHQKNKNKHRNRHERRRQNDDEKHSNNFPPNNNGATLDGQHLNKKKQRVHQRQNERKQRPAVHKSQKERKEHRQQQLKVQNNGESDRQLQHEQQAQQELPKKHANNSGTRRNRVPRVPEKCALRLLERCSWPQCNHSCPMVTNPLTGEEMRFLELLTSFGLDIEAVASALGMDMQTLSNMDRTELVNLLTQQAS